MFHTTFGGPTRLADPFSLYCLIPPSPTTITTLTPNKHLLSPSSAARTPTFTLQSFFRHSDATGVIPMQSPIPSPWHGHSHGPAAPGRAAGRGGAVLLLPPALRPLGLLAPPAPLPPSLTHPAPAVPRPPALSMPGAAVAMAPPRGAAWRRNPRPPPRPARPAAAAHARQRSRLRAERGPGRRRPSGPSSSSGGRLAVSGAASRRAPRPSAPRCQRCSACPAAAGTAGREAAAAR